MSNKPNPKPPEATKPVDPKPPGKITVYHSTFNITGKTAEIADTQNDLANWAKNGYSPKKPALPVIPK